MIGLDESSYVIEPLAAHHDRTGFTCGSRALDDYLRHQANQDSKRHLCVPFVLVELGSRVVMGFYTLCMSSVEICDLPESLTKKLPKYPRFPAILIGRLAVNEAFHGRGIGTKLLSNALLRSLENEIAWMVALVDAKDESARAFYEKHGFIQFEDRPFRLFMPRKEIESGRGKTNRRFGL